MGRKLEEQGIELELEDADGRVWRIEGGWIHALRISMDHGDEYRYSDDGSMPRPTMGRRGIARIDIDFDVAYLVQDREKRRPEPPPPPPPPPPSGGPHEAFNDFFRDLFDAVGKAARWRVLLEDPKTLAEAEATYKRLAKLRHPDKPGGSTEAMAELNAAITQARKALQ